MSVIALSSVPVLSFGVAQLATSGNAVAAGGKSTTCSGVGSTVTFATPGISQTGVASASKKSTSMTSSAPLTCTGQHAGTGTLAANKIKSKSTTTCSNDTQPKPSGCTAAPGDYVYDSADQLATGSGTLYKAVPTTSFTIGSTSYVAANTSSASATCPSGEAGFVLTGHLTAPASQSGKATTITACLETDSGTGTTGHLEADLISEIGGDSTMLITSSGFDPSASSIVFK